MAWTGRVAAAVGAAALATTGAQAAPPMRADLRATPSVPAAATLGAPFGVGVVVRNGGRAGARASRTALLLSRDARRDRKDVTLATFSTPAVKRGKRSTTRRTVRLPAATAPGTYRVLACADASGRVHERSERDNCAASGPITVRRATATAPPVGAVSEPPLATPTPPAPAPAPPPVPAPTAPTSTPPPGGTDPGPGPGPGTPPDPEQPDSRPASPLTISATRGTRSASRRIGPEGGAVTFTGPKGTALLTVPAGALPRPTSVELHEVSALAGLPFGGASAFAVEMEPEGALMLRDATLELRPAQAIPVAEQTPFAYRKDGLEARLHPMLPEAALKLPVFTLGPHGVAAATATQRDAMLAHVPTKTADRLWQDVTPAVRSRRPGAGARRRAGLDGSEATARAQSEGVAADRALTGISDPELVNGTVSTILGSERQIQLLGATGDDSQLALDLPERLRAKILQRLPGLIERCRRDSDPLAIPLIVGFERQFQLLGTSELGADGKPKVNEDIMGVLDEAQRCLQFDLDLDVRVLLDKEAPFREEGSFEVRGRLDRAHHGLDGPVARELIWGVRAVGRACVAERFAPVAPALVTEIDWQGYDGVLPFDDAVRRNRFLRLRVELNIGRTSDVLRCGNTVPTERDLEFDNDFVLRGDVWGRTFARLDWSLDRHFATSGPPAAPGTEYRNHTCRGTETGPNFVGPLVEPSGREPWVCQLRGFTFPGRGVDGATFHDQGDGWTADAVLHHVPRPAPAKG